MGEVPSGPRAGTTYVDRAQPPGPSHPLPAQTPLKTGWPLALISFAPTPGLGTLYPLTLAA